MRIEPLEVLIALLGFCALEQVCRAMVPGLTTRFTDLIIYGTALALAVLLSRKKQPCAESSAP